MKSNDTKKHKPKPRCIYNLTRHDVAKVDGEDIRALVPSQRNFILELLNFADIPPASARLVILAKALVSALSTSQIIEYEETFCCPSLWPKNIRKRRELCAMIDAPTFFIPYLERELSRRRIKMLCPFFNTKGEIVGLIDPSES